MVSSRRMIALLSGSVVHRGEGYILLRTGDIGYRVLMPDAVSRALPERATVYIHEVVREDSRELFGFPAVEHLELFWRLIGISGIGPKGAQKIIFAGPFERVKQSLALGDLAFLTAVPGIGKKTAQKIILELKGILAEEETPVAVADEEALQALLGLGYVKKEAQEALEHVEGVSTEARVRGALKLLARR